MAEQTGRCGQEGQAADWTGETVGKADRQVRSGRTAAEWTLTGKAAG